MPKQTHHVVTRPGRRLGDPDIEIPVSEDLASEPGIPQREGDVSFYSRAYPLETQNIEKAADRAWVWSVYSDEMTEYRKRHEAVTEPLIEAAATSGGHGAYGHCGARCGRDGGDPEEGQGSGLRGGGVHPPGSSIPLREQEGMGEVRARHLRGSGAGLRPDAVHSQHGRRVRPLRNVRGRGSPGARPCRLH